MPTRIEHWRLLLEHTVALIKESKQKISFPSTEALWDESRTKPPDLKDAFKDGMNVYSRLDQGIPGHDALARAAASLYTSYQNPPEKVRMAIVNLLRLYGDYKAASLYAFESIAASDVPKLLLQHMPLVDREGCLHLDHLTLPCWQPEAILGVLTSQCRAAYRRQEERGNLLWALVHSSSGLDQMPQHLCTAIGAFLYTSLRAERTASQLEMLDNFVNSHENREIVKKLLPEYGPRPALESLEMNLWQNPPAWQNRKDKFKRLYTGRVQNGYVIYSQEEKTHFLWNVGPMTLYDLPEADIRLALGGPQEEFEAPPFVAVQYINHGARFELKDGKRPRPKRLEEQIQRLKPVESVPEYKRIYGLLTQCRQLEDVLNQVRHYEDFSGTLEDRYELFNSYTSYRQHSRKKSMEIMSSILNANETNCQPEMLACFFNYFLSIGDYKGAKNFAQTYKSQLGNACYAETQTQLREYLEKELAGGRTAVSPIPGNEWTPVMLRERYGQFLLHFYEKGLRLVSDDGMDLDRMDDKEMTQAAQQLVDKSAYYYTNTHKAAKYLLAAGAVLYKRQQSFGLGDMEETMLEHTIYAFYQLSCYEAVLQHSNSDVRRSYLAHALWLGKRLNKEYLDPRLEGTLENALKQYFKRTKGHDNDSLAEAILYMDQKNSVSNEEFGNRLIRLAIYYPDILSASKLPLDNQRILRHLTAYVQSTNWTMRKPTTSDAVVSIMRSYRDTVVTSFNCCPLIPHTESSEPQALPEYLQWVRTGLQDAKNTPLYNVCSEWDKKYVESFEKLCGQAAQALDANDFSMLYRSLDGCASLRTELERKPCALAFELTHTQILRLQERLDRHCKELAAAISPDLEAAALFAQKDSRSGAYSVYLRAACVGGASAIVDLSAEVMESGTAAASQKQSLCRCITSGTPEYCFIHVAPPPMPASQEELRFSAKFYYTVEKTTESKSALMEFTVSLRDVELLEAYEQMYNPGSALKEGHAMSEYTFYGRDSLIQNICQNFYDFPNAIIVLYGQRRVGKTSIANYVAAKMRRGEKKFLVVKCGNSNIQVYKETEDITDQVIQEFYSSVLQKLAFAIEKDEKRGTCLQNEVAQMKAATSTEDGQSAAAITPLQFQRMILELRRAFEREPLWRGTRILLWFDEFQQYYLYILKGVLQPEFVGFIKAFTEEYGFSLLLVGCEPMIPFIRDKRFGNTFSATNPIHVKYLSEEHAKNLICEPIQKKSGRQNPFQYVVDEIFKLSAGSPFFIQLICKTLIDELNDQKKVYASKQMIIASLHEKGQITRDKFNCLYDSLDSRQEAVSSGDNIAALVQIAFHQGSRRGGARRDIIKALDGKTVSPPNKIISELISRGIVEELQDGLHIVVRLYEAWIWENRFELGYHDMQSGI